MLSDPDTETYDKITIMKMVLDRGFGKPRQTMVVAENNDDNKRVKVYIPDNGRANNATKTIDVEPS